MEIKILQLKRIWNKQFIFINVSTQQSKSLEKDRFIFSLEQGSTDQYRSVPDRVLSSNFETSKVNSITMDACKKCAIVFENSVAALEVIGSQSIQAQVTGKVPIVNGMFSNRIFKRNPCIYTVIQLIKRTVFNCTYLWNHWKLILLLLKFLR